MVSVADHSQPSVPQPELQWWVHHHNKTNGPYAGGQLIAWLSEGTMPPGTLICPHGGQEWHPVSAWPELASQLSADLLAAAQAAAPAAAPPPRADIGDDPGMRLLLPVGRSPLAIIAGYFGLVSVIPIFAPFALLFGVLAIRDIRRNPRKHGMGRAIFGVVMGALFSLLLLVLVTASVSTTF